MDRIIGRWRISGKERGQSLVELALTLPLMLMLTMGIIEFGFVLWAHIQVAGAAGQGARAGSLFYGDQLLSRDVNESDRASGIKTAVTSTLGALNTASPNFSVDTDVQVSYPDRDVTNVTGVGERIVVAVQYRQPLQFHIIPDSIPGVSSGYFTVSSSTTMRIQ